MKNQNDANIEREERKQRWKDNLGNDLVETVDMTGNIRMMPRREKQEVTYRPPPPPPEPPKPKFETDIPIKFHDDGATTDEKLIALSFQLGEIPKGRGELMRPATLPKGWTKERDGGGYWTYILDDKKRKRFSYFYKGAWYDSDAFMHASRRFSIGPSLDNFGKTVKRRHEGVDVKDGWKVIHKLKTKLTCVGGDVNQTPETRAEYLAMMDEREQLMKDAEAWLAKDYPEWKDPYAYWD